MILKSYELEKIRAKNNQIILFYGKNTGYKQQLINDLYLNNFKNETLRYDENEIIGNLDNFISSLLSNSLFEKEKLIIISRATDKIFDTILEIIDRKISGIKIILNCGDLEKKSKLRTLFEKEINLLCVAFYEDNNKSLNFIVQNFLRINKIKFSQEIINLLTERAKGDRGNLINELNKIENLLISKKNIGFEDIQKLTNLSENYNVFEISENYLARNKRKISSILNENNYNNEDCILILRTILNRAKRLLKIKIDADKSQNIDQAISLFKPPIFWKEKENLKKQIKSWSKDEIKKIIYRINDLELLVKKNSSSSVNFISDFLLNY